MVDDSIAIILPTVHEAENLRALIPAIAALGLRDYHVLIVDDDSRDGTAEYINSKSKEGVPTLCFTRSTHGYGSAVLDGLNLASVWWSPKYYITMDADLQQDPKYIPSLVAKADDGNDVVVASKYRGGRVNYSMFRTLMSYGARFITNNLLGISVSDTTSAYRLYNKKAVSKLLNARSAPNDYSFMTWALYRVKRMKMGEISYKFKPRIHGSSKLRKIEILRYLKTALVLRTTV